MELTFLAEVKDNCVTVSDVFSA